MEPRGSIVYICVWKYERAVELMIRHSDGQFTPQGLTENVADSHHTLSPDLRKNMAPRMCENALMMSGDATLFKLSTAGGVSFFAHHNTWHHVRPSECERHGQYIYITLLSNISQLNLRLQASSFKEVG
jgi:hypothetical protein